VRDGIVVEVGPDAGRDATNADVLDASGCLVAPGFLDIHTHYDPQALWDRWLTPSSHQGVTGVVAGNCGFSIAPCDVAGRGPLLRTLDNYLALPLSLLEDAPARARRPAFGWLGNARRKAHGGFEYRTPASWLATPEVARGVIALAKLIASDHALLRERPLDAPEMQLAYYQADKAKLRQALPAWRRDIVRCPAYRRYEIELEPFIELLESGWSWDEAADIRPAWGIVASLSQANLPHASLAAD